jgi:hypothetical protein
VALRSSAVWSSDTELTEVTDEEEWERRAVEFLRATLNEKALTLQQAELVVQVNRPLLFLAVVAAVLLLVLPLLLLLWCLS